MFHGVYWPAVIVAGFAWFFLGSLWYTALFGKKWAELAGIDPENPGGNMPLMFGITLALEIVASIALSLLFHHAGIDSIAGGLHTSLLIGFFIVVPAVAINYLYQRKSPLLTAIDGGHLALGVVIAGLILSAWRG